MVFKIYIVRIIVVEWLLSDFSFSQNREGKNISIKAENCVEFKQIAHNWKQQCNNCCQLTTTPSFLSCKANFKCHPNGKIHKNLACINHIVSYRQTLILQHDGLIFPHHRSEIQRIFQDLGFDMLIFWTKHISDSERSTYLHKDRHRLPCRTKVLQSQAVQLLPPFKNKLWICNCNLEILNYKSLASFHLHCDLVQVQVRYNKTVSSPS